jgi:hypothetical protein
MGDLVLTVRVPQPVTCLYGRGRTRAFTSEEEVPLASPTRVLAIRRVERGGVVSETELEADAFIPEQYRGMISGPRDRWLTPEVRRCVVMVADNRKSVAAFVGSGDREWRLADLTS